MHTKRKGNISEAKVLTSFVEKQIPILMPWGENERYDFVVEMDGFQRIQVKTAKENCGVLSFRSCSTRVNSKGNIRTFYTEKDIDFFGVYAPINNKVYLVPIRSCNKGGEVTLRIKSSKNNQKKRIRWAVDFEF